MRKGNQTRNFWDQVDARYLDVNGNGKLDAGELMVYGQSELDKLELLSKIDPSAVSEGSVKQFRSASQESVRNAFIKYIASYNSDFRCGIEMPNDTQINSVVALEHETAWKIDRNIAHPSLAAKIDALMVQVADDFRFHTGYTLALLGSLGPAGPHVAICPYVSRAVARQ